MRNNLGHFKVTDFHIHKLNNMLTVIRGNAELIKLKIGPCEEVEEIIIGCEKCLNLLKNIGFITKR